MPGATGARQSHQALYGREADLVLAHDRAHEDRLLRTATNGDVPLKRPHGSAPTETNPKKAKKEGSLTGALFQRSSRDPAHFEVVSEYFR